MATNDHSGSFAAWTTVLIVLAGIALGAIAVVLLNWPLFWLSVGVIVLGGIVGKVMQMMGLGKNEVAAESVAAADSDG
jgi:hypothetical protein